MGACEKKKLLLGTEPQRKCYCAAPNGAEKADRKGFPMAPCGHAVAAISLVVSNQGSHPTESLNIDIHTYIYINTSFDGLYYRNTLNTSNIT